METKAIISKKAGPKTITEYIKAALPASDPQDNRVSRSRK
jgi:hypothetical protein